MPKAAGSVQCNGSNLVGTFNVDGISYYLSVDVKPAIQPFEGNNVTLSYDNIMLAIGECKWKGAAGRDGLQMNFGGGISLAGPLGIARSSIQIRGEGTWSTIQHTLSLSPVGSSDGTQNSVSVNPFPPRGAVRDPAKVARELELIHSGRPIIAIFGQSGVGKSSFINLIASVKQTVGEGLQSCTSEISVVEARIDGKPVVVIDTPGIDDTRAGVREADVLLSIANLLDTMGKRKVYVTGVLFLHRISDNKFSQTADRVSNMLKNLCGDDAMNHLTLCTTMWDMVPEEAGLNRFDELCRTGAWNKMISTGAGTAMISCKSSNAKAEAAEIVTALINSVTPVEVAIQDEMVNKKLKVVQTGAGRVLDEHLHAMQAEAERELQNLRERLRQEGEVNAGKVQKMIRAREKEIAGLKEQLAERAREREQRAEELRGKQEEVKRTMKERLNQLRQESEASVAKAQEELQRCEKEVALLKQQGDTDPARLKRGADDIERLQGRLLDVQNLGKESVKAATRAHEEQLRDLKRQVEEHMWVNKAEAKQQQQESKSATRTMKDLKSIARREAKVEASRKRVAIAKQQLEINEAKRQLDTLTGKPPRSGILKLLGFA